jgi:hypothetical protein
MERSIGSVSLVAAQVGGGSHTGVYVAIAVALLSAVVTLFVQRQARANAHEIESLRARLEEKAGDRDARRDYEYEARKRLYSDVEPLLFQLTEAVESALRRVSAVAVNAREGALREESTWLTSMTEYYATFTMYQFILPAAITRLVQEKLTFVDFGVDEKIHLQFRIAKQIHGLWRSDHDIRRFGTELEYSPHEANARELRYEQPERYWKQGIPTGYLDIVTSAMIVREGERVPRVLTFEEFSRRMNGEGIPSAFEPLVDLFRLFHPMRRPMLWRILAGEAILFRALLELKDRADIRDFKIRPFTENEILARFDWREDPNLPVSVLVEPFEAAAAYLRGQLGSAIVELGSRP